MSEKSKVKVKNSLFAALGIDDDDIAANQGGQLTRSQYSLFWAGQRQSLTLAFIGMLTILLCLAAFMFAAGGARGFSTLETVALFVALGLLTVIGAGMSVLGVKRWRNHFLDIKLGEVDVVEGRVQLSDQNYDSGSARLEVEGHTFHISGDLALAMANGQPYAIYYTHRSNTVVGANPVNFQDDDPFIMEDYSAPMVDGSEESDLHYQTDNGSHRRLQS